MAIKQVALLALAAGAFAQMMDDGMGGNGVVSSGTSPTSEATSTSMVTDSSIGVTNPATTATDTAMTTSAADEMNTSTMSADYTSETPSASMESVVSSAGMSDMSSITTVTSNSMMVPVGTGGATPNATSTRQAPVPGTGAVSGISVGLFVVTVTLTALIQL
ncbi:hypothetical protein F4779DRAFT_600708 [Xylariaceae sp. FL0662B]|nr:hypothetical protein F4779DRAFT_600708 [Xylariaceae sp. FL0662B]